MLADQRPGHPLPWIGIRAIVAVTGSRTITNAELLRRFPDRTDEDVVRRTGVRSRQWVDPGEDVLSLAASATRRVLRQSNVSLPEVDAIICATTSPNSTTPSLACRIAAELAEGDRNIGAMAFDINAACSGFIYALRLAYDYLRGNRAGNVLIITTEVLSQLLDLDEFGTSILFGDASSATMVSGQDVDSELLFRVYQPYASAEAEDGTLLSVPLTGLGTVKMQGRRVFELAVRTLARGLRGACKLAEISPEELKLIVPHQANQRILDAVGREFQKPVFSNISRYGNTSSTSIPLALREVTARANRGDTLGLCSFGGGFTFGGAVMACDKDMELD